MPRTIVTNVYDIQGRRTSQTTSVAGTTQVTDTYTDDANDQVTSATGEAGYSYDNAGNRTMSGYTTTANNRLVDDGTYAYQYDDEGNVMRKTSKSDSSYVVYAYDGRNRQTDVTFYTSGGSKTKAIRYMYDANDQIIRRELDATGDGAYETIQKRLYNDDDLELTLDGGDAVTARYLRGDQANQVLCEESGGQLNWQLSDHQGTLRRRIKEVHPAEIYRRANSIRFPSNRATFAMVFSVIDVLSGSRRRSTPVRLVLSCLAISTLLILRWRMAFSSS